MGSTCARVKATLFEPASLGSLGFSILVGLIVLSLAFDGRRWLGRFVGAGLANVLKPRVRYFMY
jgi:hypothetical protein